MRHDEHVGVLEVAGNVDRRPGPEEADAGGLESVDVLRLERHRPDEDQVTHPGEGPCCRRAQLDVQAVPVRRADVERDGSSRQVPRTDPLGPVGREVNGVGDERDRAPAALAASERRRADDHLADPFEEHGLGLRAPGRLGRGAVGEEPVVRHVVEGRPAGGLQDRGAVRVVDPQQRGAEPGSAGGSHRGRCQPLVDAVVEASREPLRRLEEPQSSGLDPGQGGPVPEAARQPGSPPAQQVVQGVDGRLHEQDAEPGVALEEACDEVLVPPPHLVPPLQRQDDQIRSLRAARLAVHSTLR